MSVGTGPIIVHTVTPVLHTSTYATGDVMAVPIEVPNFFDAFTQAQLLQSVHVLDKDDQGVDFDIVFLGSNVSLGTLNAAVSISDSDAEEVIGVVSVASADYKDLINSRVAVPQFNPMVLRSTNNAGRSLWVGLVSRGAGTYTASGIVLNLGFLR